jgi:undecaprenyl-diphosphatase
MFVLRGLAGIGAGTGEARRLLLMIVVATIPAVVVGLVVEKLVRGMFASPFLAAMFLVVNGFLLLAGDKLRRQGTGGGRGGLGLESLDVRGALAIGVWQCFAFIPGISRSGAAMVGGLVAGLAYSEAAHFSFLIATPVIAGAAVLEIPKMLALPHHGISGLALVAGIVAGITAYLSTAFLMRYFSRHNFDSAMVPFAIYCWVAGVIAMAWLGLHG